MRTGPATAAVLILAAGALGWWWIKPQPVNPAGQPGQKRAEGGNRGGGRSANIVPVTVATVKQEAVPVYRDGIGTVQALNTVTVRPQVDGRLLSVQFTEGQMVKKGDVLARIDPTTYQALLDQAIAKKAQDQATLTNARLDLGRYQRLAQSNAGPKQQADQQVALVAQLEAQVKSDDAAIANAKAVLDYTTIASPLEGRTGLRQVDPGNIVKAGDSTGIVSITQIKPIAVIFTLPQRDLAAVNIALARGIVPVEAMQEDGRTVLASGTLQTVDNQIDVSTGTIKLKATFPNDDSKLWPGQFVSARVAVDNLVDAKVVPTAAVRRGPSGTFVYVVEEDKAFVRPVRVAIQDAVRAVIGEGVAAGDRVVTIGFAQLSDGKAVLITPAPGEAPAAQPGAEGGKRKGSGEGRSEGRRKKREEGATSSTDKGAPAVEKAAPSAADKSVNDAPSTDVVPTATPPVVTPPAGSAEGSRRKRDGGGKPG